MVRAPGATRPRRTHASAADLSGVQRRPPDASREDWIQALVRANFGVAFMPESIARTTGLDHVFTADVPIVRDLNLVVQAERPPSPARRLVMNCLRTYDWGQERRSAA